MPCKGETALKRIKPDKDRIDKKYWNDILKTWGLGLDRGNPKTKAEPRKKIKRNG